MPDQKAPNDGDCSPSQFPSETSPSQHEERRIAGAISDNSVQRHLQSGKLGRPSFFLTIQPLLRKAY